MTKKAFPPAELFCRSPQPKRYVKSGEKLAKYSDSQEPLSKELSINGARIKFIVLLVTALIKVQSVNFERLAQEFDNEVELSSKK